jgi:hypothetical protein
MSFTSIRHEMRLGLKQKGGILTNLLVLFFAGIAVAEDPGGRDLRGPPGPGWAKISEPQLAIIAEELDLGIDDTLISQGGAWGARRVAGGDQMEGVVAGTESGFPLVGSSMSYGASCHRV